MKILDVKYERPYAIEKKECPDAQWRFVVTTDTMFPHGYPGFGGLLRSVAGVGTSQFWEARHFINTDWAEKALSREGAIQNLLPIAMKRIEQWKQEEKQKDNRMIERRDKAAELHDLLKRSLAASDLDLKETRFGVNDWELKEDAKFSIHLRNLSEAQALTIIKKLEGME